MPCEHMMAIRRSGSNSSAANPSPNPEATSRDLLPGRVSRTARTMEPVADTRGCAQCGMVFVPQREHARFCSPRCRIAWNHQNAIDPTGEDTLGWAIIAMRQAADRLLRARAWDPRHAFTVISEAVWWVTMVDATLVRYHPDAYGQLLASYDEAKRRIIEDTFAGLRFVRNQMRDEVGHHDFIRQPSRLDPPFDRVAAWTWKPLRQPVLTTLPPRGQDWELTRYRAYQGQLVGHVVGDAFRRTTTFLRQASATSAAT